jgi:glutathione S-transferase
MKSLDLSFSPYASRIRIVVRLKHLPVAFEYPPQGLKTTEFKAAFPLGKIPILELDDGTCIPESWAIMEYLEESFPEIPLSPTSPLARAQMRVLGRCADLHLGPALFPLFVQLKRPQKDETAIAQQIDATRNELAKLARLLQEYALPDTRPLHLGDIALVPTIYYVTAVLPLFGAEHPLDTAPLVARWWKLVSAIPEIAQTLKEIDEGFRRFLKQG